MTTGFLPLPWRVLYRTPRGTSVEQHNTYPDARACYSAVVAGSPSAFHVVLYERKGGDWLLCDQFHDPTKHINALDTPRPRA